MIEACAQQEIHGERTSRGRGESGKSLEQGSFKD